MTDVRRQRFFLLKHLVVKPPPGPKNSVVKATWWCWCSSTAWSKLKLQGGVEHSTAWWAKQKLLLDRCR